MRAAREGTKDGLEKTKAAVKKGRSFIRTKSFISQGICYLQCFSLLHSLVISEKEDEWCSKFLYWELRARCKESDIYQKCVV